jgi:predicted secreted protein
MSDDGLQVLEYCFRNDKQAHVKFVYKDGSYQTGWAAVTQYNKDTNYNSVSTVSVTLTGVGAISEVTAAPTTTP